MRLSFTDTHTFSNLLAATLLVIFSLLLDTKTIFLNIDGYVG